MTPDKMESFLRDHCKLFGPQESFARDDVFRNGWRMSGPMYGVCAPTPTRRNELLDACVLAINKQFGIHLAQLNTPVTLLEHVIGAHVPLEQSHASARINAHQPQTEFQTNVKSESSRAQSSPSMSNRALSRVTSAMQSRPANNSPNETPSDPFRAAPHGLGTPAALEQLQHEWETSSTRGFPVPATTFYSNPEKAEETPFSTPAVAYISLPSGQHMSAPSPTSGSSFTRGFPTTTFQKNQPPSAGPSVTEPHPFVTPEGTELYRLVDVHNFGEKILEECAKFGVSVSYVDDGHVVLDLEDFPNYDAKTRRRLLDLAEDALISYGGSSRLKSRIHLKQRMSLGVRTFFFPKPTKAAADKPSQAMKLTEYLATACASSLRSGESIDVVSVSPQGTSSTDASTSFVDVVFVVRGMKGCGLKSRAEDYILPIVKECLTNVYDEGQDAESDGSETWERLNSMLGGQIELPNNMFSMLAEQHGVRVVCRTVNGCDLQLSRSLCGRLDALDSFCASVPSVRLLT
ncbi:Hypothetical protein, putative, partial [Bodo saltans]